jgi:hypothetical protein
MKVRWLPSRYKSTIITDSQHFPVDYLILYSVFDRWTINSVIIYIFPKFEVYKDFKYSELNIY